jgi:DNA primase
MIDTQELKRQHNVQDIAHSLGVPLKRIGNRFFVYCPFHDEHTPSCHVFDGGFHCFGCGEHGDAIKFVMQVQGCSFRDAVDWLGNGNPPVVIHHSRPVRQQQDDSRKSEYALSIWDASHPITGTSAERYFDGRGINKETVTSARSIRFHPRLYHSETKATHPAVIFLIEKFATDTGENESPQPDARIAIHRIYLSADCTAKLETGKPKMLLGSPSSGGIWFDYPAEIMAIAEGPESALWVRQATELNTICGISAGCMASITLPPCIRELHVFPDEDTAGLSALSQLSLRAKQQGIQIYAY